MIIDVNLNTGTHNGGRHGESQDARKRRMIHHWGLQENTVIYPVGTLISEASAKSILEGTPVMIEGVRINRIVYPVANQRIGLANINEWGCPVCHSAHGTGVAPSPRKSVELLAGSKWFYNPTTQAIFTISASCWGSWVVGINCTGNFNHPAPYPEVQPEPKPEPKPKGDKK